MRKLTILVASAQADPGGGPISGAVQAVDHSNGQASLGIGVALFNFGRFHGRPS